MKRLIVANRNKSTWSVPLLTDHIFYWALEMYWILLFLWNFKFLHIILFLIGSKNINNVFEMWPLCLGWARFVFIYFIIQKKNQVCCLKCTCTGACISKAICLQIKIQQQKNSLFWNALCIANTAVIWIMKKNIKVFAVSFRFVSKY